jgi:hypothetical protein
VFPPFDKTSDVGVTIDITTPIGTAGTVTLPAGVVRSGDGVGADCTGTTTVTCTLPDLEVARQRPVVARALVPALTGAHGAIRALGHVAGHGAAQVEGNGAVRVEEGGADLVAGPEPERLAPQESATVTFAVRTDGRCIAADTPGASAVMVAHAESDSNAGNDSDSDETVIRAGGACHQVPVTGARIGLYAAVGALMVLLGIVLLWLGTRRTRRNPA